MPILVTLLPIVTDSNDSHDLKASLPILVIVVPTITDFIFSLLITTFDSWIGVCKSIILAIILAIVKSSLISKNMITFSCSISYFISVYVLRSFKNVNPFFGIDNDVSLISNFLSDRFPFSSNKYNSGPVSVVAVDKISIVLSSSPPSKRIDFIIKFP